MELRKHWDPRVIFMSICAMIFVVYMLVGLQQAGAKNYEISAELSIPSIGLDSDVTTLYLEDHELSTPDSIVGSFTQSENKTLLIGHSTTVFQGLDAVEVGDEVVYDDKTYRVVSTEIMEKSEISMAKLLSKAEQDTLVIMTCAGALLDNGDATHRLIVTAVQ